MSDEDPPQDGESGQVPPSGIVVQSFYVRERHAMALYADFGKLYTDYYLHLMQHQLRYEEAHDVFLKDALAAIALHLTSRPIDEMTAWTVHENVAGINVFVTGERGQVCGRVFTKDVKDVRQSLLFSQVTRPNTKIRQSTVEVSGQDFPVMIEQYYDQSEQLPARYFRLGGDELAMIVAQPDIDMEWFRGLTIEQVRDLHDSETLSLLEARFFQFRCGCDLERIKEVLAPAARDPQDREELFAGDPAISVQCPRCAGVFEVTREALEEWLEGHPAE